MKILGKRALITGALIAAGLAAPGAVQAQDSDIVVRAKAGRVATEAFGRKPFMTGVRMSPDGKHVVLKMGKDGREYLAIMPVGVADAEPQFILATEEFREAGDRTAAAWRWVGNDQIVITLLAREFFFGQRGDISRLIAYDIKTKKVTELGWTDAGASAANILHIDHDKQKILLSRTSTKYSTERWDNPEVVEIDVKTGRMSVVMAPNPVVRSWFADSAGVVRMAAGSDPDNGKLRIMYRSGDTGYLQTISNEADKDFTGAGAEPQFFLPEPDMAIVADNKDGYGKLYRVNLRDPSVPAKLVFQSKGYDVSGVETSADDKRIVGYSTVEARSRTVYTDPIYKTVLANLEERFGKGNVTLTSSDLAETKFVFFAAEPSQAGSYYLYDTVSGGVGLLGHRRHTLADAPLNPVSMIRYTASDGESIEAVLTMPRHRPGTTKLPLVILTHGGPFGPRDTAEFDNWAQTVAELGYAVVQPNYRGSGGYGAEWIKKGRSNGFGLRMQDDLDDVITHLAGQGVVDPARVCMMGWSYGGYASARAAQRNPDKYRCTIAGAGVYDLVAMREYDKDYLGKFGSNYLAKGAVELSSVSPTKNAEGRWAPIMIVHGVRDQRVPVAQARGLVAALKGSGKKQGVDFDYLEQPKNTHNLPYDDVETEWLKAVENWLAKHNPAYIDSDADKPVAVTLGG